MRRRVSSVNGGHCVPWVRTRSGTVRSLEGLSGPVVGAMPNLRYRPFQSRLEPGDLLVLHTDGVTEACNEQGAFFGVQGLQAALAGLQQTSPAQALQTIVQAVQAFAGSAPQHDDITLLVLHRPEADLQEKALQDGDSADPAAQTATGCAHQGGTDRS